MARAINIQCLPTPFMWAGTTTIILPPPSQGITDETGTILTDENGNILMPETAIGNPLTDEKNNTVTDENGNPLAPEP
jgi:hypothetical protein